MDAKGHELISEALKKVTLAAEVKPTPTGDESVRYLSIRTGRAPTELLNALDRAGLMDEADMAFDGIALALGSKPRLRVINILGEQTGYRIFFDDKNS